jgi:hypothetical protein
MNPWGYELIPPPDGTDPTKAASTRGVYKAMLTEFATSPYRSVEVRFGHRDAQAIYMGLRNSKKAEAPLFDSIRIRKEGTSDKSGKVYLER